MGELLQTMILVCLGVALNLHHYLWVKDLESLPKNLKVGGYLVLSGCTKLNELPEDIEVDNAIVIDGKTGLTSISKNLKIGGIIFENFFNKERPDNEVEGSTSNNRITWHNAA